MFVYFIQSSGGGPIKIGKADHPQKRLAVLQAGSPTILEIRAVCRGGHAAERHLHVLLANDRLHNEWFKPSLQLEEILKRLPTWEAVNNGAFCPEIINNSDEAVIELFLAGYTYEDIAGLIGATRQRAHQIVNRDKKPHRRAYKWVNGYPVYEPRPKRKRRPPRPEEPIAIAYKRLCEEHAGVEIVLRSEA